MPPRPISVPAPESLFILNIMLSRRRLIDFPSVLSSGEFYPRTLINLSAVTASWNVCRSRIDASRRDATIAWTSDDSEDERGVDSRGTINHFEKYSSLLYSPRHSFCVTPLSFTNRPALVPISFVSHRAIEYINDRCSRASIDPIYHRGQLLTYSS